MFSPAQLWKKHTGFGSTRSQKVLVSGIGQERKGFPEAPPFGRSPMRKKIPWAELALWVPTLFLVYVFVPQGLSKFSDTSGWARAFRAWHFPDWFRVLVGIAELAAAALLLLPRTAPVGAAIIAVVMLGGMGTHVYWGHPGQVTSEVLPLTLSLLVLFFRLRQRRSLA